MTAKRHVSRHLKEAARSSLYREPGMFLGTVSATNEIPLVHADRSDIRIKKVIVLVTTAVAADDNDYWTWDLQNKGTAGTGTTSLFATPPTSKAASLGALDDYVAYELEPDQNQEIAIGETLSLVLTKAGNAPDLTDCVVQVQYLGDF